MSSEYRIVVQKAKGNFSVYCPELPGCVATGSTRKQAKQTLLKAIQFHLEGLEGRAARRLPPS